MIFAPGATVYGSFGITSGDTAANADSAPTIVVRVNGTIGAISVSQTNPTTGEYTFSFAVPGGATVGDWYEVLVTATVGGKAQPRQCVMEGRVDNTIASRSTYAGGNVTVGAYAAGQSPADLVLATPVNKLATDGSGRVTVGTIIASALTAIRGELEGAGSSLATLLSRLTSTRATYLDALSALTEGRMVWLERLSTAMEETSTGSGIWRWTTLALSRVGLDITAIRGKTDALPADPASEATVNSRLATTGYTAPDNAGIANTLTQAANAAASASSADGKLTSGRLANLDATTLTRLGILNRLASMMEQVTGLWRWTSNTQSQAPVTDANTVAAAVVAQALIKNMAGLTGANQVCRDFTYDGSGNLTSFRIRIYDNAENAQTDNGATGLVASHLVTNTLNVDGQITKTTTKRE